MKRRFALKFVFGDNFCKAKRHKSKPFYAFLYCLFLFLPLFILFFYLFLLNVYLSTVLPV